MVFSFDPNDKSLLTRTENAQAERKLIQTKRLTLMPMSPEDAPSAFKWVSDAEVAKYMRYTPFVRVQDEAEWLSQLASDVSGVELGVFLPDGELVGSVGLQRLDSGEYELGYHFARNQWGKGYATESCKAILAWAATELSANGFSANVAKQNARSVSVLDKCGFSLERYGQITKVDNSETFVSEHRTKIAPTVHRMNLRKEPFCAICAGHKTVELRLYDEKRRKVAVGDLLAMECDGSTAIVQVTELSVFDDFKTLYQNMDLSRCGYLPLEVPFASPDDMRAYYTEEQQKRYGVVGISIDFCCVV